MVPYHTASPGLKRPVAAARGWAVERRAGGEVAEPPAFIVLLARKVSIARLAATSEETGTVAGDPTLKPR